MNKWLERLSTTFFAAARRETPTQDLRLVQNCTVPIRTLPPFQLRGVSRTSKHAEVCEEDLHIHFCSGKGAGDATPKGWSAIECAARAEGILFDPIYTGKAFAGLLELNAQGYFAPGQNIVFFHTGGMAVLFQSLSKDAAAETG